MGGFSIYLERQLRSLSDNKNNEYLWQLFPLIKDAQLLNIQG
jgi:hypothetical protein